VGRTVTLPRRAAPGAGLAAMGRGGAINLAGAAVYAVLGFLTVVAVARGLGPTRAGVFFGASALFLIVSHICELGADTGLVRTIPRFRVLGRGGDIRRVVWIGLTPGTALAALAAAGLFVAAPQVAAVLTQPRQEAAFVHDLRLLAPFLPASVLLTLLLSATRGFGRMTPSVAVDKLGRPLVQLAGIFAATAGGLGLGWVALAWAGPFLLAGVPAALWLRSYVRAAETRPDLPVEPAPTAGRIAADFWKFSLPRALAASLKVGVDKLDIILVGALASARAAGIYAASTRLLMAGTMAAVAIAQSLGPTISRHFATGAREDASAAYQSAAAWVTLFSWPVYLTLMIYSPVILRIFGRQYGEGWLAVLIVGAAMLVAHAVGPVDVVLLMGGRSLWSMTNMVAGLSTNVVLNLLLVPRFGLTGAGLAWAASLLVINLLALAQVWRALSLHPFGPGNVRAVLAGAVCFGGVPLLVRLTAGPTVPSLLAAGVLAGALYAAWCWRDREALHLPVLAASIVRPRRRTAGVTAVSATALVVRPDSLSAATRGG
jgi:O-antigen/teichoic acid export membrane protein